VVAIVDGHGDVVCQLQIGATQPATHENKKVLVGLRALGLPCRVGLIGALAGNLLRAARACTKGARQSESRHYQDPHLPASPYPRLKPGPRFPMRAEPPDCNSSGGRHSVVCVPRLKAATGWAISATACSGVSALMTTISAGSPTWSP